jgi:putative endonuclease
MDNSTGSLGESIVAQHLVRKGFRILDRNFRKPWGEIDIVAIKDPILHFIEVKSSVLADRDFRPEERVNKKKILRLNRAIQSYLACNRSLSDLDWQIDVVAVYLDVTGQKAVIRYIPNVTAGMD